VRIGLPVQATFVAIDDDGAVAEPQAILRFTPAR
jgi:hypothetical protein